MLFLFLETYPRVPQNMWVSVKVPRFLGEIIFCFSVLMRLMRHYEIF